MQPKRVCALFDKSGELVSEVEPQTNLDDLFSKAADWACCVAIPRGYATHAVMDKLIVDGYAIRWGVNNIIWEEIVS